MMFRYRASSLPRASPPQVAHLSTLDAVIAVDLKVSNTEEAATTEVTRIYVSMGAEPTR